MSNAPVFAVFYDLASCVVTKKVFPDRTTPDSDANLQRGLMIHKEKNEGVVFVPIHEVGNMKLYLDALGISLIANTV